METTKSKNSVLGTVALVAILSAWGWGVAAATSAGVFQTIKPLYFGPLVAAGIIIPFLVYLLVPPVRRYFENIGVYPLTVWHIWRIPAALAFFWYGFHNQLPPVFWILAGVGDFFAGLKALPMLKGAASDDVYFKIHRFGFADFVVAVGTGLTYTLINDPRMQTIRELPMVLIPLFGVGISGASHLIAFDLLRRKRNAARHDNRAYSAG